MATSIFTSSFLIFVSFSLFLQGTYNTVLAEIVCEQLPSDVCAFSIASSGKRCLLEKSYNCPQNKQGQKAAEEVGYECRTSEVVVANLAEYIETDECVNACGVDRKTLGISSDAFFEHYFTAKLCSPACYQNCPNIVDLYYNLAAAEGVFLPGLCEVQKKNPRRAMGELLSNGGTGGEAPGPISGELLADSPVVAPGPTTSLIFI